MNIVLLESLGVPEDVLNACAKPLTDGGHTFAAYPRDPDPQVQIERAREADVIMLANMPLSGEVIRACPKLKFIDVAFTGVDHVDLAAAGEMGVKVSNAAGYSTQAVAELSVCLMLSLLRNVPQVEDRCRAGGTKDGLVGRELGGKTVGIVGAGAIGLRTAELCRALAARFWPTSATSGETSRTGWSALAWTSCSPGRTSSPSTVPSMRIPGASSTVTPLPK